MTFWSLSRDTARIAVVDHRLARSVSYGELQADVQTVRQNLRGRAGKQLGFVLCRNTLSTIAGYLAALQARDAVCLINADLHPTLRAELIARYRPDWILAPPDLGDISGYRDRAQALDAMLWRAVEQDAAPISPDLALLLSTSGTTGSPKMVRLSYGNLQSNARSITEYLSLTSEERPICWLPVFYSFGLSIINSHLAAGATLLLTGSSVTQREFWDFFRTQRATSLSGVPHTYQILERIRLKDMTLPSLRTLTQAGGRLAPRLVVSFDGLARSRGWRFFVMYGQTEAAPRISYVPPERLANKIDSIGIAIPGGALATDSETGELIYRGPNVMMGYAESRGDLERGDDSNGILRTGDISTVDADGFYRITGRLKRFAKLFGQRINLEEIERSVEAVAMAPVACFVRDERLVICAEGDESDADLRRHLFDVFHIPYSATRAIWLKSLPRKPSGKVDHDQLVDRDGR
jgi:long-chain acyl-CoA synthetase